MLFTVMSLLITFFGMSKTMAYYQKNANANVFFGTAEYVPLTIGLDNTIYPSGNNSSEVFLTVNNTNDYNVTYTISFDNQNATYLVDFGALTTYEVNANSGNAHVITINGATGTAITVSINATQPYSVTHTKVINFDNINPTVNDIGGGTTLKAGSQSLTLKCSDSSGIAAYYFGTAEPTSATGVNTTTSADLTALTSSSGLSKTVTTEGTYWFACKDTAGNFAKKSIVIRKYQVQRVMIKSESPATPYTSTNYELTGSASTYYVKDGTTLILTSIYTIPSEASAATFKGYTTSAPSSTAQTPSTIDPVVATNNTTTYYMWFTGTTVDIIYDLNTFNNMNYWSFITPDPFNITYDSNTKMSTISMNGIAGWEIAYFPIATEAGKSYTIYFSYQSVTGYQVLSGYHGIGVQVLSAVANNDNSSNKISGFSLIPDQDDDLTTVVFGFNATGSTTYFALNLGMAADGNPFTVKFGNFRIIESRQYGTTMTGIPNIGNGGTIFSGWYTSPSGGSLVTNSTPVTESITYYAQVASTNSYRIFYGGMGATTLNNSNLLGKYDAIVRSGNTIYDMSSKIANGTATNVTFTSDYMEFNGSTSWVNLGRKDSNYMTMEATFMITTTPTGSGYVIGNLESGGGGIFIGSDRKIGAGYYIGGSYRWLSSTITIELNKKYHVALTYDGTTEILYINGVLNKSMAISGTIKAPESSTVVSLGSNPYASNIGQEFFKGRIYNAAVYNTAISASQIALDAGKDVSYANTYGTLPTPVRAGHTFAGWYTKATGGSPLNAQTTVKVAEDHTIYARWTPIGYTLTINPNGGSYGGKTTNTTVIQSAGTTIGVLNNPTRAGYVFNGWNFSGTGEFNFVNNDSASTSAMTVNYNSSSSTAPAAYNNQSGSGVTTSIVSDSSSTGGYSARIVTNGAASPGAGGMLLNILPAAPGGIVVLQINAKIPTGYSLAAGGVGQQYTGIGSITRADTLAGTGAWKSYYLVYYIGDTGTFSQTAFLYLNGSNNTSVTWYVNSITMRSYNKDQFYSLFKFKEGNGTLTASWSTSGARVKFNTNGGTFNNTYVKDWVNGYNNVATNLTSATRVYLYDIYYNTAPASTDYYWTPDTRVTSRAGYTLEGWYTAASGGTKIFNANGTLIQSVSGYSNSDGKWIKYDGNVELYAHWSTYTLTLRYNVNGGTIITGTGSERWRASSSRVQRSTDSGSTWETVTAVLSAATADYDLWNVGTYGATKTGYTIDSDSAYNTKANGKGVNINQQNTSSNTTNAVTIDRINGGPLTSNRTIDIYIKWVPGIFTVNLDQNGGSGGTTVIYEKYNTGWYSNSGATSSISSITVPSRTGYTFGGYYNSSDTNFTGTQWIKPNGQINVDSSATSINNITLKAKWTTNSYTVTLVGGSPITTSFDNSTLILLGDVATPVYQSNGISAVQADKSYSLSFDYKVKSGSNRFQCDYYPDPLPQEMWTATTTKKHADWSASSSSSAMNGASIRFFDDVTDSNEQDITIMNVMLSENTTKSVTYGSTYGTLPSPTRSGYTFSGWYTASEGGSNITSGSTVSATSDHTLYARWAIVPIRVYYHVYGGTTGNGYTTVNGGWVSNDGTNPFYQTVDWSTDIYNYTTFGISRDGYNVSEGAEWCTQVDGGGTCLNQDTTYTYEYLKSLGSGTIVSGAYETHFYMNWTSATRYQWRAWCQCMNPSWAGWINGGGESYSTASIATYACQHGRGSSGCYSKCGSASMVSYSNCTGYPVGY